MSKINELFEATFPKTFKAVNGMFLQAFNFTQGKHQHLLETLQAKDLKWDEIREAMWSAIEEMQEASAMGVRTPTERILLDFLCSWWEDANGEPVALHPGALIDEENTLDDCMTALLVERAGK